MEPVCPRLVRAVRAARLLLVALAVLGWTGTLTGCGGGSLAASPDAAPPAAPEAPPERPATSPGQLASGWRYRFDMIAPPNDNFAITTREVYVYFKPDTTAVSFQVENRLGVPIRILWDESTFLDVYGRSFKAVHRGVTYATRDLPQEAKILQPGERYADAVIPVDLLNDPSAAAGGTARLLLPTDLSAQSLIGRSFGPTLVLLTDEGTRLEFETRFKIVNVYNDR